MGSMTHLWPFQPFQICHAVKPSPVAVLVEKVLKLLRQEAALGVICPGIAAVLVLVYSLQVDAEERVRQPARDRGIGKVGVDDDDGEEGDDDAKANGAEPAERVARPDDAVSVRIEEGAVLLQHRLMPVSLRPVVLCRAVWV